MQQPTLSVVMSNYNHAHFLPQSLQAILDQSYQPLEFIVIDDASTDNSVEILEQFAKKHPIIRLIRNEQNMGVTYNYGRLLEISSGDYICVPAADDKILPGLFEKSMSLLTQHPQAGLCSSLSLLINENNDNLGLIPNIMPSKTECYLSPEETLRILHQQGPWMQGNTTIYRRQAWLDAGGVIPELHSFYDGFIQQVIVLQHGACFIPEPLGAWRRMESGYSSTINASPEMALDMYRHATYLMRSTYQDLFPSDYVDEFEAVTLCSVYTRVSTISNRTQADLVGNIVNHSSLIDRLFLTGLQRALSLTHLLTILYLFIRLKRRVRPVLARKMSKLIYFYNERKNYGGFE